MKCLLCLLLAMAVGNRVQAQDFHDWKVNYKIVDEAGQPILGAEATVFYDRMAMPDKSVDPGKISGLTDSNGVFTASHRDRTYGLAFVVKKDGYYSIRWTEDFHGIFSPEKLNRNLSLVLKKVGQPIAMYARRLNTHVPALDKPVGFDLMAGDWIAPYGKGVTTDVLFSGHFDKHVDGESDFTLTVSFPKVGDGIQEFAMPDAEKGSGLRSPHEAPTDGYQSQWVQTDNRKPGKPIETNRDPNRNYFFRVRTALDSNGNVQSALYGKIYGDFMQFSYYLNPTPNSRNIEFDPKQNLLGGLQSFEQVTAP
jgi:hypothetical protein